MFSKRVGVLLILYILVSLCASVNVPVEVNGEMKIVSPLAGKSMKTTAEDFCHQQQIKEISSCLEGLERELIKKSTAEFLLVSTSVEVDGEMVEVATNVGEDPSSAASRWCEEHNISVITECSLRLSEILWKLLEEKHRVRLTSCLAENLEVGRMTQERQEERLNLIRGSISVMRLRVKLTHSSDPESLELLGLGELLLGFNRRGENRLLQAIYLDPHLQLTSDILNELRRAPINDDYNGKINKEDKNKSIDQIAAEHMKSLKKRSSLFRETDCSSDVSEDCPQLQHQRIKLPRIHISELLNVNQQDYTSSKVSPDVIAKALKGQIPYVLTGAMYAWDWTPSNSTSSSSRWNYSDGRFLANNKLVSRVRRQFEGSTIEFFPSGIGTLGQFSPHLYSFGDAVKQLDRPSGYHVIEVDNTNEGAYVHWGGSIDDWKKLVPLFSLQDDSSSSLRDVKEVTSYADIENKLIPPMFGGQVGWMEACFLDSDEDIEGKAYLDRFVTSTRWFAAYFGEAGGGMFNHQDNHRTSAWQAQVQGSKRWHLCSPDQTLIMNGRGGIDVFNPDYAQNPQFLNATCYDDVVGPGEMVFYPGQYWHATQTLSSPTVSLSSLLVDQTSWREVVNRFREVECGERTKDEEKEEDAVPGDDNDIAVKTQKDRSNLKMCSRLEKCFDLFENKFKTE